MTERSFNSASLAEAANHFIAIGEQATFNELETFMAEDPAHTSYLFTRGYSVDERIAWVFRIVYEPKESIPHACGKDRCLDSREHRSFTRTELWLAANTENHDACRKLAALPDRPFRLDLYCAEGNIYPERIYPRPSIIT